MQKSVLQKAGGCITRIFEFFGDLSLSPSFVFRELEHVLIPEFGDLILGIQRWLSSREWQEQIPRPLRRTRDNSVAAKASPLRRVGPQAKRRLARRLARGAGRRRCARVGSIVLIGNIHVLDDHGVLGGMVDPFAVFVDVGVGVNGFDQG